MINNSLMFSISTQMVLEGRELKSIKPNKDGVYEGIPLTVIDLASRNNALYNAQSVIGALTSVTGKFSNGVQEGNLEGEWGHPLVLKKEDLPRLLHIDRTRVSHYFTKVYTAPSSDGKYLVVYANVVPFGPFGSYLTEAFQDPKRDASFSMRSIARVTGTDGIVQKKTVVALPTFDAVDTPGYRQANARFRDTNVSGNEAWSMSVSEEEAQSLFVSLNEIGNESLLITSQQILDIFGANKVVVRDVVNGRYDHANRRVITPDGQEHSLFNLCYKYKG